MISLLQQYFALFAFAGLLFIGRAFSQEQLVPIDKENRLEKIDGELEMKLRLFPEYTEFRQAFLFRLTDSTFVCEIWYQDKGTTLRSRRPLTAAEADLLRSRVTESIHENQPMAGINQDGRPALLGNVYTLSLGLYGWGIPYLLDLQGSVAVGSYLLLSAGGILIAHSATENVEISEETANLSLYGSMLGIAHGILFEGVLYDKQTTPKGILGAAMLGSAIEGTAGFLIADRLKLSAGSVEMIGTLGATGFLYGWGASSLLDLNTPRSYSTAILAGSVLGMCVGADLVKNESFTSGDVGVFRGTSLVVTYLPLSILVAAHVEDTKVYVATAMAGGIVGGYAGYSMVQGKDFTTAEGTYIMLGAFGGILIGGGIPVLVGADPEVAVVASSIGGLIGLVSMYRTYSPTAQLRGARSALEFHFYPESLVAVSQRGAPFAAGNTIFPLAQLTYHF